jgi:hypothetical protein
MADLMAAESAPPPAAKRSFVSMGILLGGLLFLAVGGVKGWQSLEIATAFEQARGQVIRKENAPRDWTRARYTQMVAFTAHDGQVYHAAIASHRNIKIGDSVTVYYRRDNPSDNWAGLTSVLWGSPLLFGGIGCVLTVVWMLAPGIGAMYRLERERRLARQAGKVCATPDRDH